MAYVGRPSPPIDFLHRYIGPPLRAAFAELLPSCRVWVNGDPAERDDVVAAADEVAVLPPVSGGC